VLVLLRTGMRIGELLGTRMEDIQSAERKVMIFEAAKNRVGRVVYLSEDAVTALRAWLRQRDAGRAFVFCGRGREALSYTAARLRFHRHLERAGLIHKGYSLHSLRHTFATELLNAGMRLECLQQLLGHSNIELTRRYARLTDRTREESIFGPWRSSKEDTTMVVIDSIVNYRRFLKRRNYSKHTVKNYLNALKHFVLWVAVPTDPVIVPVHLDGDNKAPDGHGHGPSDVEDLRCAVL